MQIQTDAALTALRAASQLSQYNMPFDAAFAVRRLVRELSAVEEDVKAEQQKLWDKLALRDEAGQPLVVGNAVQFGDNQAAMDEAWAAMMATPVDIAAYLETTGLKELNLQPAVLIGLGDLLVEPEHPTPKEVLAEVKRDKRRARNVARNVDGALDVVRG